MVRESHLDLGTERIVEDPHNLAGVSVIFHCSSHHAGGNGKRLVGIVAQNAEVLALLLRMPHWNRPEVAGVPDLRKAASSSGNDDELRVRGNGGSGERAARHFRSVARGAEARAAGSGRGEPTRWLRPSPESLRSRKSGALPLSRQLPGRPPRFRSFGRCLRFEPQASAAGSPKGSSPGAGWVARMLRWIPSSSAGFTRSRLVRSR